MLWREAPDPMAMLRDFLTLTDLSKTDLSSLLHGAARLKKNSNKPRHDLANKTVALVFQKPSMRTRAAFEVAVLQLGGSVVYLGQEDIQLGQREPIKDVARVLSRYVDAIVVRTFAQSNVEEFARYSSVPIINGLSDLFHPCQALADLLTIEEHFRRLKGLRLAYVGDGNNVLHSLVEGCAMVGIHVVAATPRDYRPNASIWQAASRLAKMHSASVSWTPNPFEAVSGSDVIYTDVWVSMGKEKEKIKRLRTFARYQVNRALLNKAKRGYALMHCLPAHRGEEITNDVMEDAHSLIFEQAENRLHVQKALLLMLLGRKTTR